MPEITHKKKRLSSFKLIVLGFAGVILLGALILMLPLSSTAGVVTPFHEALFTSTSAVCVTGLVVQDTGSYWSAFAPVFIEECTFKYIKILLCSAIMPVDKAGLDQPLQHAWREIAHAFVGLVFISMVLRMEPLEHYP